MKAIRTNDESSSVIEVHNGGSFGKTLLAGGVGAVAGGAAVFGVIKGPELIKKLHDKHAEKKAEKEHSKDASREGSKETNSNAPSPSTDSGAPTGKVDSEPSKSDESVTPKTDS